MKNLKIVKDINEANFITHSGKFHIDDVFSTVFLANYFENVRLKRVGHIEKINEKDDKIIYDIGYGKFDHHQGNALKRKDGTTYSSFGLLWKEYGKYYLKKINCNDINFAWNKFDNTLVKTIDKIDNSQIEPEAKNNYLISNIIENYNPAWNSKDRSDVNFLKAVNFANKIFKNEIKNIFALIEVKKFLERQYITLNDNFIVLKKYVPYQDFILEKDIEEKIQFIIYPSNRNGVEIITVLNRKKFPVSWHNMNEIEFYKKYGIRGMLYCHSNGNLCIANNIETAKKIVALT